MGPTLSRTFNHPDLLVAFGCDPHSNGCSQKWHRCYTSGALVGDRIQCFPQACDPGWVRNSPLRIELVDLLTDALKAMGGWPSLSGCFGQYLNESVPPQLVLELNKVCKKFNDAKLFDMGLQCRAIIYLGAEKRSFLLVLVEKKSEYKLLDLGDKLEHISVLEKGQKQGRIDGGDMKAALAWSPPEDWMTRLTPPYNEATNHV